MTNVLTFIRLAALVGFISCCATFAALAQCDMPCDKGSCSPCHFQSRPCSMGDCADCGSPCVQLSAMGPATPMTPQEARAKAIKRAVDVATNPARLNEYGVLLGSLIRSEQRLSVVSLGTHGIRLPAGHPPLNSKTDDLMSGIRTSATKTVGGCVAPRQPVRMDLPSKYR